MSLFSYVPSWESSWPVIWDFFPFTDQENKPASFVLAADQEQ